MARTGRIGAVGRIWGPEWIGAAFVPLAGRIGAAVMVAFGTVASGMVAFASGQAQWIGGHSYVAGLAHQ